MKMTRAKLVAASITGLAMMVAAISPANAKCTKKNPLFGFEYYVADKHCPQPSAQPAKKTDAMKRNIPSGKTSKKLPAANAKVKEVQMLLLQAGYMPGAADGISGPTTVKALNNFKTNRSLPSSTSTSDLMPALRQRAAHNMANKKIAMLSPKEAMIHEMQVNLSKLGYEPGPADGVIRPATVNAMGYFRQNYGVSTSASRTSQMAALNRIANR